MKFPGETIAAPTTAVRVVEKAAHASARPPFDTVTITLHWLTAVVVLTLVGSGLLYGLVEDRPGGAIVSFSSIARGDDLDDNRATDPVAHYGCAIAGISDVHDADAPTRRSTERVRSLRCSADSTCDGTGSDDTSRSSV
jgi:hypothetical protein